MTNKGKTKLFNRGRDLKLKHNNLIDDFKLIISNVERCIDSSKYFLLGILSNSKEITIKSKIGNKKDVLFDQKDQKIYNSIDNILKEYKEDKTKLEHENFIIDKSNKTLSKEGKKLDLNINNFSIEIPYIHNNLIFHGKKFFK